MEGSMGHNSLLQYVLPGKYADLALLGGDIYFADPARAVAGDGSPDAPCNSIATAEGFCIASLGDTVVLRGLGTTDYLTAALTWDKNYTSLIGIKPGADYWGRARVANAAASTALTHLLELSATGCRLAGINFWQGGSDATALGTLIVSGDRNRIQDCHIGGIGNATPAGQAGAYCLSLTGSENLFENCWIGIDTVKRTAANAIVLVDGGATRNHFKNCVFISWAENTAYPLIKVVDTTAIDRTLIFEDCLFYNFWTNHGNKLAEALTVPASMQTCDIILRGKNMLVGITEWESNDRGNVWIADAAPTAATSGIAVEPAT